MLFEADGSGQSEFSYTGEWYESYSHLLFLRARYYDPAIGRFVSKDVFPGHPDSPQSLNGWSYVGNNSLKYTDPSGLIYIEGWGYTCDDPAVVNGMGPDGKPCVPAPPGATLETLELCSPIHPGDESWKSRPQCNYHSTPSEIFDDLFGSIDGYVEGVVETTTTFLCTVSIEGVEVVYDFQTRERGKFRYKLRYGVASAFLDVSVLAYAGPVWGFKSLEEGGSISQYEGIGWSGGVSGNAPFLPGGAVYADVGAFLTSSVDDNDVPDLSVWGVVVPIGVGAGTDFWDTPLNASVSWTKYTMEGPSYPYGENTTAMVQDLIRGIDSPIADATTSGGVNLRRLAGEAFMRMVNQGQ